LAAGALEIVNKEVTVTWCWQYSGFYLGNWGKTEKICRSWLL